MNDYSEVPIPPEINEYTMEDASTIISTENSQENDEDSLWQQQLVKAEKEMLKEKENGKRALEETNHEDESATKKRAYEFERLWKNVEETPTDFQAWTILLQHVDVMSELESGRQAYNAFFKRYPYCYGYWKKFADLEKKKGSKESTLKVFNRGVEAIKLSVDLWIYFLEFVMTKCGDDENFVREHFDRSIESCGIEFRSDKLWDLYITWETNGKRWSRVTALYDKVLAIPICKYNQNWVKFQEHVSKHPPSVLLSPDEYLDLRKEVLSELNRTETDTTGEAPPPGEELSVVGDETSTSASENLEEENKMITNKIIETRQKIHEYTVTMAKPRWTYEDAIKRPYFHVKPLEKSQLNAWRNYLDFEISFADDMRIKVLFERCLIACAFYEEFWMRYIYYLEEKNCDDDLLRSVFSRACTIHLREKLKPHIAWAAFEEDKGHVDFCLKILQEAQERIDMSLEAYMMSAAVERRRGNLDDAEGIYKNCLEKLKDKENKNQYSCIVTKYARFLALFRSDRQKASNVLNETLQYDSNNYNLLVALADNALMMDPPRKDLASDYFKLGTANTFPPNVRMMFAHRYLHFTTECADDTKTTRDALKLLRVTQREVRQQQTDMQDMEKLDSTTGYGKPKVASSFKSASATNSHVSSSATITGDPSTITGNSTTAPVNGTSSSGASSTAGGPGGANSQGYNYGGAQGSGGYGPYPQGGYGNSQYYQGWGGYPPQQPGYGAYNQQWGNYQNYYGQR